MRYISPREENWTWLILAGLWAVGGIAAWFYSLLVQQALASGLGLFLAACIVAVVGVALRLPMMTVAAHTDERSDHLVMLLGFWATVNWLGMILLHAANFSSVLPAMLVIFAAEGWLHLQFYWRDSWPWLLVQKSSMKFGHRNPSSANSELASEALEPEQALEDDSVDRGDGTEAEEEFVRRTFEGVAEGKRFLSGEIQLRLQSEERSQEVIIGFCPPFQAEPGFEFELTDERIGAQLQNRSPAGVRLIVRRQSGMASSEESLDFCLQWYAAEAELPVEVSSSLP